MKRKHDISGSHSKIVGEIAANIRQSRYLAARSVNKEIVLLYFSTGKILSRRIKAAEWGEGVLDEISAGIQGEFPGIRGFSISNLKNMRQFYEAYSILEFGQSVTGQIDEAVKSQSPTGQIPGFQKVFLQVGFTHHILLLQKCPDLKERFFYMENTVRNQWSVAVLQYHIESNLFRKKGKLFSNFDRTLPHPIKKHALEAFRGEYLLNFVNIIEDDSETVLESELVKNLRDFLMSLGREFAFLGNQYRLVVDDEEFFVDLLFYHRGLRSLVAIELKAGKFKPDYAGKMNFYLESLDQYVKLPNENPSIGIILCKEKKNTIVEFAFKRIDRPMGVATYVLDDKLPRELSKYLPSPSELKRAAVRGI